MQERDPVVTVEAEVVEPETEPDPVELLPPLRTVEEEGSPELTFAMLNEMLKRVGKHQPVIDFDLAWPAWGYSRKGEAVRAWKAKGYVEGKDWALDNFATETSAAKQEKSQKTGDPRGGHNKESIYLTIHCFKRFCVHLGTKPGIPPYITAFTPPFTAQKEPLTPCPAGIPPHRKKPPPHHWIPPPGAAGWVYRDPDRPTEGKR
jgi:hypothetical protein